MKKKKTKRSKNKEELGRKNGRGEGTKTREGTRKKLKSLIPFLVAAERKKKKEQIKKNKEKQQKKIFFSV